MPKDMVEIDGTVVDETEDAFYFTDGVTTAWLPKSQCQWDHDSKIMRMPEWMAMNEGLI